MCVGLSYHVWYAFVALLCVGVLEVEPASLCVEGQAPSFGV